MSRGPERRTNQNVNDGSDNAWVQGMLQALQDQANVTHNLVQHLTQNAPQQAAPVQQPQEQNRTFFRFHKMNLPIYKGEANPMAAQYWLETMEKIFSFVACSKEEKVIYATHMLQEEADFWWKEAKAYLTAKEVPLTWENFS